MTKKYMKTYMGVITGSFAGRDDGYPEQKTRFYDDLSKLVADHDTQPDEKYYVLEPMPKDDFDKAYDRFKTEQQRKKDDAEKLADLAEIERLKKKHGL